MKLLLDTHVLLWSVWTQGNLSSPASAALADPANELLLSPVVVWEIALKVGIGKLNLTMPFDAFMAQAIADLNLKPLPLEVRHANQLTTLPFHHRDPFDRMLAAQALSDSTEIVSADTVFDQYGVKRHW